MRRFVLCLDCGLAAIAAPQTTDAAVIHASRAIFQAAAGPLMSEGFNTAFAAANPKDFGLFDVTATGDFKATTMVSNLDLIEIVTEGARALFSIDDWPILRIALASRRMFS